MRFVISESGRGLSFSSSVFCWTDHSNEVIAVDIVGVFHSDE